MTHDADLARDERLLIAHLFGLPGISGKDLLATLDPEQKRLYTAAMERRRRGEPLQYILGEWDFYGRTFHVDPRALVPRPETEHLVEEAVAAAANPRSILDLGCGSGILAVTLALEFPRARVVAVDSSLPALALARENAHLHGVSGRLQLLGSDWLSAVVPFPRFDLVVSNPPYVAETALDTLPSNVRDFEPHAALFAGPDGLLEIRKILTALPACVAAGGNFLFEFGFGQRGAVEEEIGRLPAWRLVRIVSDLSGTPRVAILARARCDESPEQSP